MNIPDGITLKREGDSIKIGGLSTLSRDEALRLVEYVKGNKAEILQEMDGDEAPRVIKPMDSCLHGGRCKHLKAPGGQRPTCERAGAPVFDLAACPVLKWARTQPKLVNVKSSETQQ